VEYIIGEWLYLYFISLLLILLLSREITHLKKTNFLLKGIEEKRITPDDFVKYEAIFLDGMKRSFDNVYKTDIVPYSINGFYPDEKEINNIINKYIKVTYRIIGNRMKEILLDIHGNESDLMFKMINNFYDMVEEDELRKSFFKGKSEEEILEETNKQK